MLIRIANREDPDQTASSEVWQATGVQNLEHLPYALTVCFLLFDLILYVPSTIFQLNRNGSSWFEPVLS